MATLGEILSAARRSGGDFERWLAGRQPALAKELIEAARQEQETPASFARAAVADFSRFASEEDWVHLTSRLRDSDDPGMACLSTIVEWRLAAASAHRSHPQQGDDP